MSTPGAGSAGHIAEGITMTGTGEAATPVDQVRVNLSVDVVRPDAGEAFRSASLSVRSLLQVLSDGGVDSRSVRTQDLTLGPRKDYRNGQEVILGYSAGQRIVVVLQSLHGIEQLLTDVATRSGEGVGIEGIALIAGDPGPAAQLAREQAFADARTKAEQFAVLAGRSLGRVLVVHEGASGGPRGDRAIPLAFRASASPMPVATGDTSVTASVTVTWAFEPV